MSTKPRPHLLALANEAGQAAWVQSNFITEDTEALAAKANERAIAAQVQYAKQAARFDNAKLPEDVRRKLLLLKLSMTLPTPSDPREAAEATRLASGLEGAYGRGKYCPGGDQSKCMSIDDVSKTMAGSRDARQLLEVWNGWHTVAPPMKKDYARLVELSNKGAKELGFADTGSLWRSQYDMPPDEFAKELDRLWEQVKPLYVQLHAYARWKLRGEVRQGRGERERAHPGAPAGQHLGAAVEQHLPAAGAERRRPGLRLDLHPEAALDRRPADGALRRGLLHLARL